jgi:hypothetical protein
LKIIFQKGRATSENYRYLLTAIVIFVLLLFGAMFVPEGLVPGCNFKHLTGYPCGGCGTFRGLGKLAKLDLPAAFISQPLIISLFVGTAGYSLYAMAARWFGWIIPVVSQWTSRDTKFLWGAVVLLFIANWAFLISDGR